MRHRRLVKYVILSLIIAIIFLIINCSVRTKRVMYDTMDSSVVRNSSLGINQIVLAKLYYEGILKNNIERLEKGLSFDSLSSKELKVGFLSFIETYDALARTKGPQPEIDRAFFIQDLLEQVNTIYIASNYLNDVQTMELYNKCIEPGNSAIKQFCIKSILQKWKEILIADQTIVEYLKQNKTDDQNILQKCFRLHALINTINQLYFKDVDFGAIIEYDDKMAVFVKDVMLPKVLSKNVDLINTSREFSIDLIKKLEQTVTSLRVNN